jgi:hypothetical protein
MIRKITMLAPWEKMKFSVLHSTAVRIMPATCEAPPGLSFVSGGDSGSVIRPALFAFSQGQRQAPAKQPEPAVFPLWTSAL